jgi:hypothetical protein
MKYYLLSFLMMSNLCFLFYIRIVDQEREKEKDEKLLLLRKEMELHNNKMAEWIAQAKKENDRDYHQWMIEQAIEEATKYSECKGVLRYISAGRLP